MLNTLYRSLAVLLIAGFSCLADGPVNAETGATITTTEQPKKVTHPPKARAPIIDTIIINAELMEIPGNWPTNIGSDYVIIMKYKVISVIKGPYIGRDIFIGHYNPHIPRNCIKNPRMAAIVSGTVASFQSGDTHRLVLASPIQRIWGGTIVSANDGSIQQPWFALKADLVK